MLIIGKLYYSCILITIYSLAIGSYGFIIIHILLCNKLSLWHGKSFVALIFSNNLIGWQYFLK